jgi:cytochrome c2
MADILERSRITVIQPPIRIRASWDETTFKQYIANPRAMIPGTKMPFAGLKDPQQINDLWAYLKQFNADGSTKN